MIKIVKGTYGYWNGNSVTPKTKEDKPFQDTTEQEERLVRLGIAVYVDNTDSDENLNIEQGSFEVTEEYLKGLNMPQLREFAKQFGIKAKVGTKKEDFADEILDILQKNDSDEDSEEYETDDDGEKAPEFSATEAVQ